MRHTKYLLLLLISFGFSWAHGAQADPSAGLAQLRQLTLTILHDNDLHGHLLPFAFIEQQRSNQEQPSRGGAARRATLIRNLRRTIRNPLMVIDTGDIATRGPLATTYEGIADVETMNAIGYDLAVVGNNEFKLKDAIDSGDSSGAQSDLLQVIKRARFPWLCANVTDSKGALIEGVEPYVIRVFDGVRVGFLGLTTARSSTYPQTKGWTISDPIAAAKVWIPEARKHCDLLIAVTHLGVGTDKELAAQTSGLDAIIGGDSHTFLYKAIDVSNVTGEKAPIVQDGAFGVDLGRFDLHFAKNAYGQWRLADYKYALLPIDPKLSEAPDVNATLEPFLRPMQTVVGHIGSIAKTPPGRMRQTNRIIVDALRQQTGSDLALSPGNTSDNGFYVGQMSEGLALNPLYVNDNDFFNVFRHSDVTRYDVYAVLPFHDEVVIATLTGSEIRDLLSAHPDAAIAGDAVHLEADTRYKVAIIDFVAVKAYRIAKDKIQPTNRDVREVVIDYLKTTLSPAKPHMR